jgi:hypothetical protein
MSLKRPQLLKHYKKQVRHGAAFVCNPMRNAYQRCRCNLPALCVTACVSLKQYPVCEASESSRPATLRVPGRCTECCKIHHRLDQCMSGLVTSAHHAQVLNCQCAWSTAVHQFAVRVNM